MSGVNSLRCADSKCSHRFGNHTKTADIRQLGPCQTILCGCRSFAWEPYEEDPDASWDDYKSGYTDIHGAVNEPFEVES